MKKSIGKNNAANRKQWLERILKDIPDGSTILDAGAGECKYKKFCKHLKYTSQDFCQYEDKKDKLGLHHRKWDQTNIDIVSDIINMPIDSCSFDAVMCIEVMEHIPEPVKALREMHRIIKIGGKLIVTAPFSSLTHFSPFYYFTGFSRNFYEYHLPSIGFRIEDMYFNGNFYEYLAQELKRIPTIGLKYSNIKVLKEDGKKISDAIGVLNKLNKKDNKSCELLCHGLNVIAIKEK